MLSVCAAGNSINLSADLQGSITSLYEKDRTQGTATMNNQAQFLNSLPERDKLEGYRLYTACIKDFVSKGASEASPPGKAIPSRSQTSSNGGVEVTLQKCQVGASVLQCLITVSCVEHECRFALYGTYAPKGAHSVFIPQGSNLPYQARVGLNTPHDLGSASGKIAAATPTRAYLTFHDVPADTGSGKVVVSYSADSLPGKAEFQINAAR